MHTRPQAAGLWRRFARDRRGASAVEFAIISSFLLIILLNVVDIAIYMLKKMEITSAVRAGAQYTLVHDSPTDAAIQTVVSNATNVSSLSVDVDDSMCGCQDGTTFTCGTDTCTTGNTAYYTTITATYNHTWLFYPGATSISADITIRTD